MPPFFFLGYGVMVTLQILVLPFLVRVRVAQPSISWRERPWDAATIFLGYGVMVTLQILVLPFLVRVRVAQRSKKRVCSSRANSLSFLYILPHPYIDNAGGGPGRHPNRLKPPDKMRTCCLPCAGDRPQARTCRLCCTSVCHFDGCRIDAEGIEELDATVDHRL